MTTGLINVSASSGVSGLSGFNTPPSTTEKAVQAAGYLGYLDLLLSNSASPSAEITRVTGLLTTLKTSVDDKSDIKPLITAGLAAYANGASAYRTWWAAPIDLQQGTTNASSVMSWLSSTAVTSKFRPSDVHSDTEFALLMFLCDSQSYTAGQLGLSSAVDSFFGQTLLSGNAPGILSEFLSSYLGQLSDGLSMSTLASLLPQDSSKTMPSYDAFINEIKTVGTLPSFNDQAGITAYWFTPVASRFFVNVF